MQRRALLVADSGALLSKENVVKSGEVQVIFYHRMSLDCVILWIKVSLKALKKKYQLSLLQCRTRLPRCLNRNGYTGARADTRQQTNTVWTYISRHVWLLFNPTCPFRLLPTTGILFRSSHIVGDVNVILCTLLMKTGANFC